MHIKGGGGGRINRGQVGANIMALTASPRSHCQKTVKKATQ